MIPGLPKDLEGIRLAQLTDIHIGFDPDAQPEELNRKRFRAALSRVFSSPNVPDLLVLSGDLTSCIVRNQDGWSRQLAVEPQQVVLAKTETADGWF